MSIRRIEALEKDVGELKGLVMNLENRIDSRLESIENFVGGYNTILGLAKKHWSKAFIFGAGVMSALGIGNPKLWDFVTVFAGGA